MANPLQTAFEYYLAHQDELVDQYSGKYIVIDHTGIVGVYDEDLLAVTESQRHYELGTFLVQKVSAGDTEYVQTFASRVTFS